jgi:hypothetical protein
MGTNKQDWCVLLAASVNVNPDALRASAAHYDAGVRTPITQTANAFREAFFAGYKLALRDAQSGSVRDLERF